MGIDFDGSRYQEKIEERLDSKGRKREKYVAPDRGEKIKVGLERQAKESNKKIDKASERVNKKIEGLLGKDKRGDGKEIRSYFEWLRLGLICAEEMKDIKSRGNGDMELVWETMLRDNEIEQAAVASSGPGGQNANKVATKVRLKHSPSGIYVDSQEFKTQPQNKKRAKQLLQEQIMKHIADWETVVGDKDENEVMAEKLSEAVSKQGERARQDIYTGMILDLREGNNL